MAVALAALAVLRVTHDMSGEAFQWREAHFDRLAGTDGLRQAIEAQTPFSELAAGWGDELDAFQARRAPYLIYP